MPKKSKGRKSKFQVGQVVMIDYGDGDGLLAPMFIESIESQLKGSSGKEEWRYLGSGYYAWESQVRLLTAKERGRARR